MVYWGHPYDWEEHNRFWTPTRKLAATAAQRIGASRDRGSRPRRGDARTGGDAGRLRRSASRSDEVFVSRGAAQRYRSSERRDTSRGTSGSRRYRPDIRQDGRHTRYRDPRAKFAIG